MNIKALIALILFFCLSVTAVKAGDFSTAIHQTYTLTTTGADVIKTLTITNLSDLLFPKGYTLFLYSDHIQDLTITDQNSQPATFTQSPVAASTKVELAFSDPVVGKGKSQTYRLEYKHPEAKPEPNFPQYFIEKPILNLEDQFITTTLIIPKNICSKPLIYPSNLPLNDQSNFYSLSYNQSEFNQSLTITCQPKRYLNITLNYQLTNPSLTPIETQVTLPPDTSSQRLIFNQIEPAPLRLNPDLDGNRIATYKLEPKQTINVTVLASAIITNFDELYLDQHPDIKALTSDQPHWPSLDRDIKHQAKQLSDAKAIYDFLTQTAGYNPDQFSQANNRHGGLQILNNPHDLSAQDFTDAFITLCRANNIASRRVISYLSSANQKLTPFEFPDSNLHIYPEWYDPNRQVWLAVDPFWQTTNPHSNYWPVTDQLRLTLAINGHNDTSPYPATSLTVTDIPAFTFPPPSLTASIKTSLLSRLFPRKNNLIIDNHSNYSLYQESFTLVGPNLPPQTISLHRLDINSQSIIPITSTTTSLLTLETNYGPITIEQSHNLVSPTVAITALLVAVASFFAVITGRLLVHRRKR